MEVEALFIVQSGGGKEVGSSRKRRMTESTDSNHAKRRLIVLAS